MSLDQKYRPKGFARVKGNAETVDALSKLLAKGEDCPHAFLLTGPTGCGKTTIGRIIAKTLGCEGTDYEEIDSADFRGIDMVRDIANRARYKPLQGTCRVFLIDECHKLTNDAQNALLKRLEEAPQHVYYILCTTDPQKLIETLIGRCSHFKVAQLRSKELIPLLENIAVKEGVEDIDHEIYEILSENSQGHVRNAIKGLEQILHIPKEQRKKIAEQAGFESAQVVDLCRGLINDAPWKAIASTLRSLKENENAEGVRKAVLGYCQAILIKGQDVPVCGLIMEEFSKPFYDGFPALTLACYTIVKQNKPL